MAVQPHNDEPMRRERGEKWLACRSGGGALSTAVKGLGGGTTG